MMIKASITRKNKGGGLDALKDRLSLALESGINAALEDTQKLAVKFSRGRVADSIQIELIDRYTFEVKGRVFTTSPFAAFLEWGTGIHMEENPLGHIPGSAGERGEPWFVHESMADLSKYRFPVIDTPDGKFYVIRGTRAHPYMKPAAFQGREQSVKDVLNALREQVKEVSL